MRRRATQTERVLRLLRARGERGVMPTDFLLPDVVDGGRPIMRLAARVYELRARGWSISENPARNGVAVYRLVEQSTARRSEEAA